MKRPLWLMVSLWGASLVWAQPQGAPPAMPVAPPTARPPANPSPALSGAEKLRWVTDRLNLTEEQKKQVEALVQIYDAEVQAGQSDPQALGQKMKEKLAEIEEARGKGDEATATRLQQELREIVPHVAAEKNFYANLEQTLTDEQKARLPGLREHAESGKGLYVRPVQVLRAVYATDPTTAQFDKIEQVLDEYRQQMVTVRSIDAGNISKMVEDLTAKLRTILTPPQAEKFDRALDLLKMSVPEAKALNFGAAPAAESHAGVKPSFPHMGNSNMATARPAPVSGPPPTEMPKPPVPKPAQPSEQKKDGSSSSGG